MPSEPRIWRRAMRQGNGLDDLIDAEEDAGRLSRPVARLLRRSVDPLNDTLSVMADRLDGIAFAFEAPTARRVTVVGFPEPPDDGQPQRAT